MHSGMVRWFAAPGRSAVSVKEKERAWGPLLSVWCICRHVGAEHYSAPKSLGRQVVTKQRACDRFRSELPGNSVRLVRGVRKRLKNSLLTAPDSFPARAGSSLPYRTPRLSRQA